MTQRFLLLAGLGGMIGSMARLLVSHWMARITTAAFPFGTLAVNIIGCLIVGIIYAVAERSNALSPEWRILLATGFCGGFTTFSTFTYEGLKMMHDGQLLYLFLYVAGSVITGFAATLLGYLLLRMI